MVRDLIDALRSSATNRRGPMRPVWIGDEIEWALDSCLLGHYRYVSFPGVTVPRPNLLPPDSEVLPAIEVVAPATQPPSRPAASGVRARPTTRNVRRVFVYPTAPTTTAGSGMDVDKVPASVNAVGAGQIARTGSLNIADALQQQVPRHHHQRHDRQSISAGHTISRFCRISGRRYPSGTGGLPERGAHQRSVRRHRQLGLDSDGCDQVGHRRDQQSRVRPQCAWAARSTC